MSEEAVVAGVAQTAYLRRPEPDSTTASVLAEAILAAIADAGLEPGDVDGLGVSSFTLSPDRPIDLAWKLGLRLRWLMEEPLGLTIVQHARRAIEAGDARNIVIVGGDRMDSGRFRDMASRYNAVTERRLTPTGAVGPNAQFSLITAEHRRRNALGPEAYGRVVMHQRARAALHRNGLYTDPLTVEEYLAAPMVTSELRLFDCVPLVTGAGAVVLRRASDVTGSVVRILGYDAILNNDNQEGDGLNLGLAPIADSLGRQSGTDPVDVDLVSVYDDYPVIVLQQLQELGVLGEADLRALGHHGFAATMPVVNPSGGLRYCGQAGAGGELHGFVDAIEQLTGRSGAGQIAGARRALVTNYGMVLYRYGACAVAMLLEADR